MAYAEEVDCETTLESTHEALANRARRETQSTRDALCTHLLKAAKGWSDQRIADTFVTSTKTVQRTRQRFAERGLQAALTEQARPGQPTKLTTEQETWLIALACSAPPEGFKRWTVRLLTSEAIAREIVPEIVPETARQILKKTNSNPGKSKAGVMPK